MIELLYLAPFISMTYILIVNFFKAVSLINNNNNNNISMKMKDHTRDHVLYVVSPCVFCCFFLHLFFISAVNAPGEEVCPAVVSLPCSNDRCHSEGIEWIVARCTTFLLCL